MKWTLEAFGARAVMAVILCALAPLVAAPALADYGFFRTVVGYAELFQGGSRTSVEVEANYPVLTGDRIEVSQRGRIEAVLADGSYLRLDGATILDFEETQAEVEGGEPTPVLRLERGEIQLVLPNDSPAEAPLRVDTVNATIYLETRGSYRIYTDGRGWTEVVVREGHAEIVTERGSTLVRAGEQSTVNGNRWPKVTLRAAGGLDDLEGWGDELLASARGGTSPYVDPGLGYAAAPLARHGSWVYVGGRHAWQPAVELGWRPYYYGYWGYTPAGLTWVSPEPWGWVTYHYGYWDLAVGLGWLWYPGRVYTPAAVYWYWGPSHVAWVPFGYYHSYYRPHHYGSGFGFRLGVHGWAGGSISHWANWTFCATGSFGRRGGHRYYSTGAEITRSGRMNVVPRGVITTDTRAITPDRWHKPAEVINTLTRGKSGFGTAKSSGGSLPDLTAWVARSSRISAEADRALYSKATGRVGERVGSAPSSRSLVVAKSGRQSMEESGRTIRGWSRERASAASGSSFGGKATTRDWTRQSADWSRERTSAKSGSSVGGNATTRDWGRRSSDRSRGRSLADLGKTASTGRPERRELVLRDTGLRGGAERSGPTGSVIERIVRGGVEMRDSVRGDWRGQASVRPPSGVSGGSGRTSPVRRVLEGVKSLRQPGRSSATATVPPKSSRSIGSAGSSTIGRSYGGGSPRSSGGSLSTRPTGSPRGSSGGGSRRSIKSPKGGGG